MNRLNRWLESVVTKLGGQMNDRLDQMNLVEAFDSAVQAYQDGKLKEALGQFEKLADGGYPRAATMAGTMHLRGQGTPKNGQKAIKYLSRGVELGDEEAESMLGFAYGAGDAGIPINYLKARPLLEKAAKRGDQTAEKLLKVVKARQSGKRQ